DSYRLDAEDWTWYHIVPSILYVLLFAGSLFLGAAHQAGVYAVAAAVLGLLFVGVRNSWDVVTYLVVRR
ncbi:MAG TPA: hypothetical protein VMF61_07100, partial [Candidatus Acidoferrales bacterium]|nr:hypothetical protein [Candidatus Acidoferrales bacterium]